MAAVNYDDPTVNPSTSVGSGYQTDPNQVAAWYQQYLGRAPESNAVVDSWAGQTPAAAQAGIQSSAEAKAYASANPSTPAPAATFTNTSTSPGTGSIIINGQAVTGAGPNGPVTATGANPWTTPAPTPSTPSPNTPGGLVAPSFAPSAAPASTPANPEYEQLIQTLLAKANQNPNVDPNDPAVQASTEAYDADQTRQARNGLSALAEKGGSGLNLSGATLAASEAAGQNTASYRANLVNTMTQQRMQAIQAALSGSTGLLTAQDQSRLQEEYLQLQQAQFGANTTQQSWQDEYNTIFG